jgi:hypothetical protein
MTNNEDFQLFKKKESTIINDDNIKISRDLNNIINQVKRKFLNDNDRLMLRFILGNNPDQNKENNFNTKNNELSHVIRILADLVTYLGKSKLDLEKNLGKKDEQEMAEYEKELQKLEAQIREHIRIEQSLKVYCEDQSSRIESLENDVKNLTLNPKEKAKIRS